MPKYGFVVVEGPHDVEFVYRLLSPFAFKRVIIESDLDPFFEPLIPREYPPDGNLQKRMETPLFLQSTTHAVAVHVAGGDSRLVETVQENLSILDPAQFTCFGTILDADLAKTSSAADRYKVIQNGMAAIGHPLTEPAGQITGGSPKRGAFVLPDNTSPGTLEDLLLECGYLTYPGLLASATTHVDAAAADGTLLPEDLNHFKKPSGRKKALIGSVASILRPGKAIQTSIQDNRWVRGDNLELPKLKAVQDFLSNLLEL